MLARPEGATSPAEGGMLARLEAAGAPFIRGPGERSSSLGCEAFCWLEWDHHSHPQNDCHFQNKCHPGGAARRICSFFSEGAWISAVPLRQYEWIGLQPLRSILQRQPDFWRQQSWVESANDPAIDFRCKVFRTAPSRAVRPRTSASPSEASSSIFIASATLVCLQNWAHRLHPPASLQVLTR